MNARSTVARSLDSLFRPRSVAVVGATPHDPRRMGTRTLFDLVNSGWSGEIYPITSRHDEIYGRRAFASLRDVPAAPDVVLARVPAGSVEEVAADAAAVGAGHLVVLASGFAEAGAEGLHAQRSLLDTARRGGVRLLGPQSIGLVNVIDGVPLSLSQIMERLQMRSGNVALLAQSGAMAISLSLRAQEEHRLGFSYIATFGNAADIDVPEVLHWLAGDPDTAVVGMYLEAARDLGALAAAIEVCRRAGKHVVILHPGTSAKGARAVASHTASMAGDARVFQALCRQLSVVLVEDGGAFLLALKALSGRVPALPMGTAFMSLSGGACALWADAAERHGFSVPELPAHAAVALRPALPPFLEARNPLDLGPAMFEGDRLAACLRVLTAEAGCQLLVIYLFTSSPTLMGGLERIAQLEALAAASPIPVWVVWEAATPEEWARLSAATSFTAFRDLGQASLAAGQAMAAGSPLRYRGARTSGTPDPALMAARTEVAIKAALRRLGYAVPQGAVVADASEAVGLAATLGQDVVLKVHGEGIAHKSELGGVVVCRGGDTIPAAFAALRANLAARGFGGPGIGVYAEALVDEPGVEMFATLKIRPETGLVTTVGRGGWAIEVERDFAMRVGSLTPKDVVEMLETLRCWPLLAGFRGQPALDIDGFAELVARLPHHLDAGATVELELNPVKVTRARAWILDALLDRGADLNKIPTSASGGEETDA